MRQAKILQNLLNQTTVPFGFAIQGTFGLVSGILPLEHQVENPNTRSQIEREPQ